MLERSTLQFLTQLKKNNNKPWFDDHREAYSSAKADFESFVQKLIEATGSFDGDIKELKPRDCIFRINRDIRFSKDKSPYKINMGVSLNRGGKKSIFAGYYFHLQPGGESFAGGGLWMPQPNDLKKLRQEIDYCFPEFKKIIGSVSFRKHYPGLEMTESQMLVNVPKGYEKENKAASFLKLKSFVALQPIPDKILISSHLVNVTAQAYKALSPLIKFINRSLE
ncbi:MAG TPA: DUF2461 domain-containing protein [Chitinophagaceae bacterium]|nr:DUF2461 domain-containing protein [Chitinophagaceae bacterium]